MRQEAFPRRRETQRFTVPWLSAQLGGYSPSRSASLPVVPIPLLTEDMASPSTPNHCTGGLVCKTEKTRAPDLPRERVVRSILQLQNDGYEGRGVGRRRVCGARGFPWTAP